MIDIRWFHTFLVFWVPLSIYAACAGPALQQSYQSSQYYIPLWRIVVNALNITAIFGFIFGFIFLKIWE